VIEAEAARLRSPHHERRLRRLVQRLRSQVPIAESAKASAILANACAAFERDPAVRAKLAALLLADSLGPLRQAQALAAVAA
jgi:tellurite resistance protein